MTNTQIPKIIHYCWFGGNPLPPTAIKCIESWRKFLPDYEIKEWNEKNFDIKMTPFVEEAYYMRKFAFVSDFARFWVLYNYGGIYFDVDVEVLKPMDDILARGPYMGLEKMEGSKKGRSVAVNAGLGMASYPKLPFFGEMVKYYQTHHFISWRGKFSSTVVVLATKLLQKHQNIDLDNITLCEGVYIYPDEYFDPMNFYTREVTITENTRSIHLYAASWIDPAPTSFWQKHYTRLKNLAIRGKLTLNRVFRR